MAACARHRANRQRARARIYQSLSGCFTTSPPDTKSDIITLMPWMSLAAALSSPPPTHMAGACWMISARTVPTILGQSPRLFMFWLRAGRQLAGGIGLFAPDPLHTVMIQLRAVVDAAISCLPFTHWAGNRSADFSIFRL